MLDWCTLTATITNQTELIRVLLAGVIPVIVIALPVYLGLWSLLDIDPKPRIDAGVIGGLSGAAFMLHRHANDAMPDLKPCFECGTDGGSHRCGWVHGLPEPHCTSPSGPVERRTGSGHSHEYVGHDRRHRRAGLHRVVRLLTVVFIPSLLMPSTRWTGRRGALHRNPPDDCDDLSCDEPNWPRCWIRTKRLTAGLRCM